jgi:exopolysaccharide biosynthesis polyprenyl glycosylphosphotransferase
MRVLPDEPGATPGSTPSSPRGVRLREPAPARTRPADDRAPAPPSLPAASRARGAETWLLAAVDVLTGAAVLQWRGPTASGIALVVALVALTGAAGLYRAPLPPFWIDEIPRRVRPWAVPLVAYLAMAAIRPGLVSVQLAAWAVTALVLVRLPALAAIRALRRRGRLVRRTVVVGGGAVATHLVEALRAERAHGLEVVGYVDVEPNPSCTVMPYLGAVEDLDGVLQLAEASTVVVTFTSAADGRLVELLRWTATAGADVRVVPRLFDVGRADGDATTTDHVVGIPLIPLAGTALGTVRWAAKRTFDVVATGLGLAVLWPLLGLLALGVRLSSPGPVLFRQERIGRDGQPFELLKFRSMAVNDDDDRTWSVADDDRVTRLGRIMRAYSLDELPQLWNVLRGDMSLVGPRPERPRFVEEFSEAYPSYRARHRVPVGLTGYAQVHGLRGDTSIEARARFDNAYVERWSLWQDVAILLRTVVAVLRREG